MSSNKEARPVLGLSDKVLLITLRMEERGRTPCSVEDLTIEAWKEFMPSFGMTGYELYHPNPCKLKSCLSGRKGLLLTGMLTWKERGLLGLSAKGRDRAYHLAERFGFRVLPRTKRIPLPNQPPPHLDGVLIRVMESEALRKYWQGLKMDTSFTDAKVFWDLPDPPTRPACEYKTSDVEDSAEEARRMLLVFPDIVLSTGQILTKQDIDTIKATHEFLRQRYSKTILLYCKMVEIRLAKNSE